VEGTIPAGVEPDAEQILTHAPDLVLTTARHAGERSVGDQLADAGVESLALASDDFATPESYADALLRVGEALGEEDAATQHADDLLTEIQEIDAEVTAGLEDGEGPRVLALMARGGTVMAMDAGLMLPGLAVRAGAVDAAAVTAGPADGGPPAARKGGRDHRDCAAGRGAAGQGRPGHPAARGLHGDGGGAVRGPAGLRGRRA